MARKPRATLVQSPHCVVSLIAAFLDAPMPAEGKLW
jgi:hypothetical protein